MSCHRIKSASVALLATCSRRTLQRNCLGHVPPRFRCLSSSRLPRTRPSFPPLRNPAGTSALYEWRRGYADAQDSSHPKRIAVVGGGLTGLVTAYYLARDLPETTKIVVYEASGRWGGWIDTRTIEPYVEGRGKCKVLLETGPRVISTHNRFDLMVFHDLKNELDLDLYMPMFEPRRYLLQDDSLVHYPSKLDLEVIPFLFQPVFRDAILPSVLHYVLNRKTKVPFSHDVSVGEWIRYFTNNDSIVNDVASGMFHGVWGDDVEDISALSALYKIWHKQAGTFDGGYLPLSDVRIMETLGNKDERNVAMFHHPPGTMYHFGPKGMQWLPRNLSQALQATENVDMRSKTGVEDIQYDKGAGQIKIVDKSGVTESFDKVISTVDAGQLATATKGRLPTLNQFGGVTINAVNLWYPATYRSVSDLKGVGYLIPKQSPDDNPENALGVFFDNTVSIGGLSYQDPVDKQVYESGTKLFVLLGGHYYNDRTPPDEAEAIAQAKEVVQRHLGIPATDPVYAYATLQRNCIPKHHVGHSSLIDRVQEEAREAYSHRLAFAGGSFHRPGLLGALRSGWESADAIVRGNEWLTGLEDWTEDSMLEPQGEAPDFDAYPWKQMTPMEAGELFRQGASRS